MLVKCRGLVQGGVQVARTGVWIIQRVATLVKSVVNVVDPIDTLKRVASGRPLPPERVRVLNDLKKVAIQSVITVIAYQVNQYLIQTTQDSLPETNALVQPLIRFGVGAAVAALPVFAIATYSDRTRYRNREMSTLSDHAMYGVLSSSAMTLFYPPAALGVIARIDYDKAGVTGYGATFTLAFLNYMERPLLGASTKVFQATFVELLDKFLISEQRKRLAARERLEAHNEKS